MIFADFQVRLKSVSLSRVKQCVFALNSPPALSSRLKLQLELFTSTLGILVDSYDKHVFSVQ
jgi:hypothetical protein